MSAGDTNKVVPYEIATVDIPAEILIKHGLTEGNKQRLVALARELADALKSPPARCLVDRDLDHWFGPLEVTKGLHWTPYCSMEMYFLNEECIDNVLRVTAGIQIQNTSSLLNSLVAVLAQLYAIRLTRREMDLNFPWPAPKKHLRRNGDMVEFDSSTFMNNALTASGNGRKLANFRNCVDTYIKRFSSDARQHCHGHDYVNLLAWTVREFKGIPDYASEKAIERLFVLMAKMSQSVRTEIWATI